MAKISDSMMAAVLRGAQRLDGLISPAPKTPIHMAMAQATKLVDAGLVERVACLHDQFCYQHGDDGDFYGFRVTVLGMQTLGVDSSEWPEYLHPAEPTPLAESHAEQDAAMEAALSPPADDDATLDAREHEADRAAYNAEQEAELANPPPMDADGNGVEEPNMVNEIISTRANRLMRDFKAYNDASYLPIEAELISAIRSLTAHIPDTHAWARFCTDHADMVACLRAAVGTPKAERQPKAPREPGTPSTPREGSKQATVIAMLQGAGGVTNMEVQTATGWAPHTVRGFLAGLKKKGHFVVSTKDADRGMVYSIAV